MGIDLLGPVVDYLSAYFIANNVPAVAVIGERERVKQTNAKVGPIGGRVSLMLTGGDYEGPKFLGPRDAGDEKTSRSIYQLMAEVDVEVWAWSLDKPSNDRVQMAVWGYLHEMTLNALREFARGTVKFQRLIPDTDVTDKRQGWAASVVTSLPIPIFERPFVQTVDVTAQVASTLVFPKGTTPDGEESPSTNVTLWTGEVPTPDP